MNDEENEIPPQRLIAVANALKKYYVEEKRVKSPGYTALHRKHDSREYWNKVARQCITLNADPATYMKAAFLKCTQETGPFPTSLGGPAAAYWYKSYINTIGKKVEDKKPGESLGEAVERQELSDKIKQLRLTLKRINGSWLPIPANVEWLLRYSSPVEPYLRVLLCYPVEEVRIRYGVEAHQFLAERPQLIHAAKKLGFPIDEILLWLNQNQQAPTH